ncbi:Cytochrome P450 [Mycena venus]|uniref:Cytochrome P450 n=1 Tax=Mycena venus TaxID=2733690 RepID=A0A8H6WQ35_9AGAR|nr:Cytochrome P450 [Mycena venus]
MLPYGENLKRQRAAFHQMLQPRVIGGYEEMQHTESLRLMVDLVEAPNRFYHHFQRFPASLVFTLSYGQRLNDDGRDLADVTEVFTQFVRDIGPGAHLVDAFPVLDRLPDFLSPCANLILSLAPVLKALNGSRWRSEAQRKHQRELEVYGRLALDVKAQMEKDPEMELRFHSMIENSNGADPQASIVAGSAFAAGTDTNTLTLLWFVMAMALYPATMKKAQQEIDSVFNSDSLPNFSRMKDLPYCFALVKEVFRWGPAAPLSIPHYTDADDEYKGYTIHKGTTVISSIWNMHHNEEEFPDSYTFNPERFLSKGSVSGDGAESLTEGHYGFGFGRRKCPGLHLAAKSTWLAIVRVLWAFNIEPRKDASGNIMEIDPDSCTPGLTSVADKLVVWNKDVLRNDYLSKAGIAVEDWLTNGFILPFSSSSRPAFLRRFALIYAQRGSLTLSIFCVMFSDLGTHPAHSHSQSHSSPAPAVQACPLKRRLGFVAPRPSRKRPTRPRSTLMQYKEFGQKHEEEFVSAPPGVLVLVFGACEGGLVTGEEARAPAHVRERMCRIFFGEKEKAGR